MGWDRSKGNHAPLAKLWLALHRFGLRFAY